MSLKVDKVQLEIIMKADSARKEIILLENEARSIQKELKGLKKGTEEWVAANDKLTTIKQKQDEIRKSIGLTEMTMRELQTRAKTLQAQLNNLTPGSKKFNEYQKELKEVQGRIGEVRNSNKNLQENLESMPGVVGGAVQSVRGLLSAFKALIANPVGLIIAAIVGAFLLMKQALQKNGEATEKFNQLLAPFRGLLESIFTILGKFVGVLIDGALAVAGLANKIMAYIPLLDKVAEKNIQAIELEREKQRLAEQERADVVDDAKLRVKVGELKKELARKDKYTAEERIKIAKQIDDLEKANMLDDVQRKTRMYNNRIKLMRLEGKTYKDLTEEQKNDLRRMEAEIYNNKAEYYEKTRKVGANEAAAREEIERQADEKAKKRIEDAKKRTEDKLKADIEAHDKWYSQSINAITKQQIDEGKSTEWAEAEKRKIEKQSLEKKKAIYKNNASELRSITEKELGMQLEDLQKQNTAQLVAINKGNEARIKATDTYEQTKKQQLQDELDNGTKTQQEYNNAIAALDEELAARRLEDAIAYRDLILAAKYNSEAEREAAVKAANDGVDAANKASLTAQKNSTKQKLANEKEHLAEVDRIRKELGLDKEKLNYQQGLDALKEKLKQAEASEKESADAIAKYKTDKAKEYLNSSQDIVQQTTDFVGALKDAELSKSSAANQKELSELDNLYKNKQISQEEYGKRKEELQYQQAVKELNIQKKYADAEFAMKVANIAIAAATAIMNAWASSMILGPIAGPIAAGVMTALIAGTSAAQIAAANNERQRIKAMTIETTGGDNANIATPPTGARVALPQAAEGRYDVIGQQDRKTYRNVRYMGKSRTGLVTTPTLYGEAGTELVIDAPTLQRLNMRAPGFNQFVLQNRVVPQRADGNYDAASAASQLPAADNSALMVANLQATNQLIGLLQDVQKNGIEAFMLFDKFQKSTIEYENSLKKGSLK